VRVAYDPSVYEYKGGAVASAELGSGTFTVNHAGEGQLLVSGDYIDPHCPSYVPRMAIEMDYAAGHFLSAWQQYDRYCQSAVERGDEISALIAGEKLNMIYNTKCIEILIQAVAAYHQEKSAYPSVDMHELIDSGILMRVVQKLVAEDPGQRDILTILTYGTNDIRHLLEERLSPGLEKIEPHILIVEKVDDKETPVVYNRSDLIKRQKAGMESLQNAAGAFAREKGHIPSSMKEVEDWLKETLFTREKGRAPSSQQEMEEWFQKTRPVAFPKDPLGGEYYLDQNGKVQVRNLKY
jgi:hypothetical protein